MQIAIALIAMFVLFLSMTLMWMLKTGVISEADFTSKRSPRKGGGSPPPDDDNGGGDDGWPSGAPKLDLPPGVYFLPPGVPDPSKRRESMPL